MFRVFLDIFYPTHFDTHRPKYQSTSVEQTEEAEAVNLGPQIVASFNGPYLVRGGNVQALEGELPKSYVVVIGFDSVQKAYEWYDSPAYAAIGALRQNSTKSRLFIVEGEAPSDEAGH